jgi:hypothetical protein
MAISECIGRIQAEAAKINLQLSQKDILELLDEYERELRKINKIIDSATDDEVVKRVVNNKREKLLKAHIEKRNRVLNLKIYSQTNDFIANFDGAPGEAIEAMLVGTQKNVRNGRRSVDYKQKALFQEEFGAVLAALDDADLVETFVSGKLDKEIMREIFVFRSRSEVVVNGRTVSGGEFGASGNAEASRIAEIIVKSQSRMLRRKNRNGAFIRELESWMMRQHHDSSLLRKSGFDEWYNFLIENDMLDLQRMVDDLDPKRIDELGGANRQAGEQLALRELLQRSWENLVKGNHMKVDDIQSAKDVDVITAFKGPANIAKSASQSRVIHFKGPDEAYNYAKKYSRMNFSEAFMSGLEHDAQSIVLMETLGPNPNGMLQRIVAEQQAKEDVDIKKPIRRRVIENQMKEVDGSMRTRSTTTPVFGGADFADIASGWRIYQNIVKLGGATISSFSDIATKAAAINAMTDKNIFQSYGVALRDVFSKFNTKDQRRLAYLINVGTENMQQNFLSRFGSNDSGPGMLVKAQQLFFKYNGMQWWNKVQKVGVARIIAADLAEKRKTSYARLPAETQNMLIRYGIDEGEWDLLRSADMLAADGKRYMVAQAVDDVDPAKIDAEIQRKTGKLAINETDREVFLDELRGKLSTLYTDIADIAVPTPGAKERAIMNQGLLRGTPMGEAIRTVMQLKAFPITYITKGMASQYHMSGKMGVAKLMIGATIMGYISMSTKDILRGREPRDAFSDDMMKNKDVFLASFLQGGGAGIFGDFLFGEANRYGQSFTTTLLGPTAGTADDIYSIYSKVLEGDDAATDAFRLGLQNAPLVNLFYTRAAMEYLFLYGIQEAANPGYLKRVEKRLREENDQEYFLSPTEYAVKF